MAKLSYRDAEGVVREHELEDRTTLGRHPSQMVQILDRVVSKQHAVIEEGDDGQFYLWDDGSRNGTYLNGSLVDGKQALSDGDRITIGSTDLYFQQTQEPEDDETISRQFTRHDRGTVTIHSADVESQIQSRVQSGSDRFLPEQEIDDVDVLRRDYEKLRIAHDLSRSIGLEMDLDVLLEKILDKAFELFPADRGVILLNDEDSGELVPMEVKSRDREGVGDVRISETILEQVSQQKEAFLSSDAMSDSRFSGSESIMIGQIRSTMSVPMLHDDELRGVIHLDTKMASGAFTEKDLVILSGFARRAAGLVEHHRLLKKMEDEIVVREKVRRLLPPELVEEVVSGRLELRKGGELRRVTVMFADIREFTSYSEQMPPQDVLDNINEYFELMVDIIFDFEGTLDKFIGDEIMAMWGAPLSKPDDADRALKCAVAIQEAIDEFNEQRRARDEVAFDVGVGINTGEVVAGYTGSTKRMNYTVMGDTVNIASRLCDSAGPGDVLIGGPTHDEVGHLVEAESLPPTELKGRIEQVDIYRVLGLHSDARSQEEDTLPERRGGSDTVES
jgi:adenylate cyclase